MKTFRLRLSKNITIIVNVLQWNGWIMMENAESNTFGNYGPAVKATNIQGGVKLDNKVLHFR